MGSVNISKIEKILITLSVVSGVIISICDFKAKIVGIDVKQFVIPIVNLSPFWLKMTSYACIYLFPFWILGIYFLNRVLSPAGEIKSLIISGLIAYSSFLVSYYHYSYAVIYQIGKIGLVTDTKIWNMILEVNSPFNLFLFGILPISWLIIGVFILLKKSLLPKYTVLLLPTIVSFFLILLRYLGLNYLTFIEPAVFSITTTIMFYISYIYYSKNKK